MTPDASTQPMAIDVVVEGLATFTRGVQGGCTRTGDGGYRVEDVVGISISQADGGTASFEYVVPADAGFGGRSGEWAQVTYKVDYEIFGTPPSTFWVRDDAGTVIVRFVGRNPPSVNLSPQTTISFAGVPGAACSTCSSLQCGWFDYDLDVVLDGGTRRVPYRSSARVGEWMLLHNGLPTTTTVPGQCPDYRAPHQAIVFNRIAPP